jgi:Uma2 family endonuclease
LAKPSFGYACVHVSSVYVQFPDGSLERPDIAIFCSEPDETEDAISLVPEAEIEVVSKGYEAKDLEIGPPFYLAQGVKDVIVCDPTSLLVLHARREKTGRGRGRLTCNLARPFRARAHESMSPDPESS